MNTLKCIYIFVMLVFSFNLSAQFDFFTPEEILKAVINAKRSSKKSNLKHDTLERRFELEIMETKNFINPDLFGSVNARLNPLIPLKNQFSENSYVVTEISSSYPDRLRIHSNYFHGSESIAKSERSTGFHQGQIVIRQVHPGNIIVISAFDGKMVAEVVLDYTDVAERGLKGEPKVTVNHMSGHPLHAERAAPGISHKKPQTLSPTYLNILSGNDYYQAIHWSEKRKGFFIPYDSGTPEEKSFLRKLNHEMSGGRNSQPIGISCSGLKF